MLDILKGAWNFIVQVAPSVTHFICGQVNQLAEIAKINPAG